MHRFLEALRLAEKQNGEATSEESSTTKGALGVTHLNDAILSKADKHDVLLYIETTAAHAQKWNQKSAFNGRALYSYVTVLLQSLRSMHSTECEKRPLSSDAFFAHRDFKDKDLFIAGEQIIAEHNESFLLRNHEENKLKLLAPRYTVNALFEQLKSTLV